MRMPIIRYGEPVLETPAKDVEEIDEKIRELVANMLDTMYAADGIGLAANQVGVPKRVAVIDPSLGEDLDEVIVLINPEIVESAEEEESETEGCLSFPEIQFEVSRSVKVSVKAINLEGEEVVHDVEGMMARVFQHEIDHLNGVLFIDYLKGLAKEMVMTKIKNMKRRGEWDLESTTVSQ